MFNIENKTPLLQWIKDNQPKETMYWKGAFQQQMTLFTFMKEHYNDDISVVSTHTSKSILLPVILIPFRKHTEIIVRHNFYNYAVSISSSHPDFNIIPKEITNFFSKDKISSCYCEGFEDEWVFGTYSNAVKKNTKQCTIHLDLEEILLLMVRFFGGRPRIEAENEE